MSYREVRPGDIVVLGPPIESAFVRKRRAADGRVWAEGYTQGELDVAQERYSLRFPPGLVALFLDRRPVLGWDWRTDDAEIRTMLAHPSETLLFDIEINGLWWPEWGDRPLDASGRAEILRAVLDDAPKLIPLLSHRHIPAEPNEAGNPVFSVMGEDTIVYGANLADYFANEFERRHDPAAPLKRIPFWSDLVERNC